MFIIFCVCSRWYHRWSSCYLLFYSRWNRLKLIFLWKHPKKKVGPWNFCIPTVNPCHPSLRRPHVVLVMLQAVQLVYALVQLVDFRPGCSLQCGRVLYSTHTFPQFRPLWPCVDTHTHPGRSLLFGHWRVYPFAEWHRYICFMMDNKLCHTGIEIEICLVDTINANVKQWNHCQYLIWCQAVKAK